MKPARDPTSWLSTHVASLSVSQSESEWFDLIHSSMWCRGVTHFVKIDLSVVILKQAFW